MTFRNKATFLIVRNPFDRLVSAFRDTLEKVYFHDPGPLGKIGKDIIRRFRNKTLSVLGRQYLNNYSRRRTIIDASLTSEEEMRDQGIAHPKAYFESYDYDQVPTFYEFVQHLIHDKVRITVTTFPPAVRIDANL